MKQPEALRLQAAAFDLGREDYELALTILEGKPVWEGDVAYNEHGEKRIAKKYGWCDGAGACIRGIKSVSGYSWNPPQPKLPEGFEPWPCDNFDQRDEVAYAYSSSTGDIIGYRIIKKYEEPKTVMVELPTGLVRFRANLCNLTADEIYQFRAAEYKACCKALDKEVLK